MDPLHKLGVLIRKAQRLVGLSCPRLTSILLQAVVVVQIFIMVSQRSPSIANPPFLDHWKVPRALQTESQIFIPTGEAYACSAWRATDGCSPKGLRHSKSSLGSVFNKDLACNEYIPVTGAGYCELVSERGEVVRAFQKSCLEGQFRPDYLRHFFTCDMAVSFMNYKYQAHQFEPDHPLMSAHNTTGVQDHVHNADTGLVEPIEVGMQPTFGAGISQNETVEVEQEGTLSEEVATAASFNIDVHGDEVYSDRPPVRGIVMEVYDQALVSTYSIVRVLREVHGCNLPIELWSEKGENVQDSPLVHKMLAMGNIRLRVINDPDIHTYMTKPFSIAYSNFDQVLFLDSDNFPIQDPTYLFDTPEFQANGAMFWKDYWVTERNEFFLTKDSVVWELLGFPSDSPVIQEMEMESGEILIDRRRSQDALRVLLFLTKTYKQFLEPLSLVLGDKDLFRLAWHMTQSPFHYIAHPPGIAGFKATMLSSDRICGRTMVQHDPSGQRLFFHRNAAKFLSESDVVRVWEAGLEFAGTDPRQEYYVEHRPSLYRMGSCYHCSAHVREFFNETDYQGTEIEQFEDLVLEFARQGFRILNGNSESMTPRS